MTGAPTRPAVARDAVLRGIEDEMGVLVRRLKRSIAERARALHPSLQGTSYFVLGWLAEHGPVRPSVIVEAFGTDKGAMSRQLQHLEELDLVERTPDPTDGRATLVSATAAARGRLADVDRQRRRAMDEKLTDWSVDDLAAFTEQLSRYNRSLDSTSLE